jgi:hypothetical protein
MTLALGVMLGAVGCVLPFVAGYVVEKYDDGSGIAPVVALTATAAIYWTALIVWLVMR